jgi:acyl-CoA hydrolase
MKKLEPEVWNQILKSGAYIYLSSGSGCPKGLLGSLQAVLRDFSDLNLIYGRVLQLPKWLTDPVNASHIRVSSLHLETLPESNSQSISSSVPCPRHSIPQYFREGIIPVDVALISVTPPDAHGYCSLGSSADAVIDACKAADVVVAQVNRKLPRTFGDCFLHHSEIDWALEMDEEPEVFIYAEPSNTEALIGAYAAQLIEDGATLHLGVDPISQSVYDALQEHKDLGIYSPILGDGALDLIRTGVVNNSQLKRYQGRTVTSMLLGQPELYDWASENAHLSMQSLESLSNPGVLATKHKLTTVCAASFVDLSGQAVLASGAGRYRFSLDSDALRGAALCPDGKAIVALPSLRQGSNGPESTIVPWFTVGLPVEGSQAEVQFVVTERGIATLQARSVRDRIAELVQVAHPAFQENLLREARERELLPKWFHIPAPYAIGENQVSSRRVRLKDDKTYILRPLSPADDHRLQEFFYSHSQETIHSRYGFNVKRMGEERAHELVSIDQNKDLALGVFELKGARQLLHSVGRFYLDKTGKSAEIAFITRETKRRVGMTSLVIEEMMEVARERDMEYLWAQVDRDNFPMLKLFQRYHPHGMQGDDESVVKVAIPLNSEGEIHRKHRYSILRPFRKRNEGAH